MLIFDSTVVVRKPGGTLSPANVPPRSSANAASAPPCTWPPRLRCRWSACSSPRSLSFSALVTRMPKCSGIPGLVNAEVMARSSRSKMRGQVRCGMLLGRPRPGFLRELRLRRGEAGDRHPIGRTRHVVEPDLAAKADRRRVAAVLAANPKLQSGPGRASTFDGDADQFAHPFRIDRDERVLLEDAEPLIGADKARGIVARQAIGGLRQVVGAEAEEFRALGDLAGQQRGARQLDHRP